MNADATFWSDPILGARALEPSCSCSSCCGGGGESKALMSDRGCTCGSTPGAHCGRDAGWDEAFGLDLPPGTRRRARHAADPPILSLAPEVLSPCMFEPLLFGGVPHYYLQPPARSSVASYTGTCFDNAYGPSASWPPSPCPAPCISGQGLPCDIPIGTVGGIMPVVVLDGVIQPNDPNWTYLTGDTTDEQNFVAAAIALLQGNSDLVEWAVCLAANWSPIVGILSYFHTAPSAATIVDCVMGALTVGGFQVYLLGDQIVNAGATGWAQDLGRAWLPGPTIPMTHPVWVDATNKYATDLASGVASPEGLCMVAAMAETLLHELIHICTLETLESNDDPGVDCWAIQDMAAISFMWALGQRYPCLKSPGCCKKTVDLYFMTSEPDVPVPPEPWPWDFDASSPC